MRTHHAERFAAPLLTGLVVTAVMTPPAGAAAPAAQPAQPTSSQAGPAFYTPPSPLPAGHPGDLIRYRTAQVRLGPGQPSVQAWTVMYHSRDVHDRDVAVTGTVLHPVGAGAGPQPVVSFAVGTQGLGHQCAPSRELVKGTLDEAGNVGSALRNGWNVVVTDYEGYTNGATPSYLTGPSEGHAVLDILRAARHVPGSGVTKDAKVATWGYSQGGQASMFAAVTQPTYAPGLRYVGDASGGVPADPRVVGEAVNGSASAGLLLYLMSGYATAYGDKYPVYSAANATGLQVLRAVKDQCLLDTLPKYAGQDVSSYLKDGRTVQSFNARPGPAAVYARNTLTNHPAPTVPVYQYHAVADEIVPIRQAYALHDQYCDKGVRTSFNLEPGDHLAADATGTTAVIKFLSDRFAGQDFVSTCPL